MAEHKVINVAEQFTRYPAGRYKSDGNFSGERFRDDFLIPALEEAGKVTVMLDGVMGYGSSFLEEVFAGLRRSDRAKASEKLRGMDFAKAVNLESRDPSLIAEIREYLSSTYH